MKSQFLSPTRTGSVVTGQPTCELVLSLLITFMQLSSSYYFEIIGFKIFVLAKTLMWGL